MTIKHITVSTLLARCGLLLTAWLATASVAFAASADRPNVIVIMTDDQGNNVGFQGNPHLHTPHIDRLAEQSVRLTNFHQMPLCTPSRAALMSVDRADAETFLSKRVLPGQ